MKRMLTLFAVAAALGAQGCVGLAHPVAADVPRAQEHFPEATLASLVLGREAYSRRCAGCHALFLPGSRSPAQWPKDIEEMERDAKLLPGERVLIEQFLVTMATRPP